MTLTLTNNYYLQEQETFKATEELLNNYAKDLDVCEITKKTYVRCLRAFFNWLNKKHIEVISYSVLLDYKDELKEQYKAKSVNINIIAIKSLFKYLERENLINKNVAKYLKKEKVNNDIFNKDCLTIEQINDILRIIDVNTLEGARANALFRLLIGTALRECEIVNADIKDITTKNGNNILMIKGKGETEKNNYVKLEPSVMKAIQHYFKFRENAKDTEPLFTSVGNRNTNGRLTTRTIQRIIKGLYKDVGIVNSKITTHSTRHTAITLSILNGANVQQAQAMARHKNVNTTMIYYHNIDRLENSAESKIEQLFNESM